MLIQYKCKTIEVGQITWEELKDKFSFTNNHQFWLEGEFLNNERQFINILANCFETFEAMKAIPSIRLSNIRLKVKRLRKSKAKTSSDISTDTRAAAGTADDGEEAAAVEDFTTAATVADREGVADILAPEDSGSGAGQDDIVPNEDESAYGANGTMDHSTEV